MRRVLITGGAGFAGSHLVEHLMINTNWHVVLIDSLSYAGRVDRLFDAESFDPSRVTTVYHDLRAPVQPYLDDKIGPVDSVLHLAAETHVDRSIYAPVPFVINNYLSTLHLLEWARGREGELTHFVQISTDEVYGPADVDHRHAEWEPLIPSNPYAASKAAQEMLAIAWWRTFNVPVVITNTMNLIGERQHPEKFVPKTINLLMSGQPVPIHGEHVRRDRSMSPATAWVSSSRHWLHARNHAAALQWVLESTTPSMHASGASDRPDRWHVAGEERDVLEIATLIAQALGVELRAEFVDFHRSRPGHDRRYALDADKIAAAGWVPPVPLEASLKRIVQWSVDHPEWLRW